MFMCAAICNIKIENNSGKWQMFKCFGDALMAFFCFTYL